MENNELIIVKQLPVIEENLKVLSEDINKQVEQALSLIVSEDTVKDVKKVRTDLSNQFKDLESQRKYVKESILKPYSDFEEVYKTYISEPFKTADSQLKEKIDNVEDKLKQEKENKIKIYLNELLQQDNIDFVNWEQTLIKVGLSDSEKSLKEKAKAFVDKISDELNLIDTQENKIAILVEYKKTLNVANAITTVNNRIKEELEAKKLEEERQQKIQEEQTRVEKVEQVIIQTKIEEIKTVEPKQEEVKRIEITTITVKNETTERLQTIIKFLDYGGYDYE